jgi:hypothetical protein
MSADNKPLLGPEYWTNIGSLSLENENYEEIFLAGFLIMELTPTIKENWIKEIECDQISRNIGTG